MHVNSIAMGNVINMHVDTTTSDPGLGSDGLVVEEKGSFSALQKKGNSDIDVTLVNAYSVFS